jgi:hypothetical protein
MGGLPFRGTLNSDRASFERSVTEVKIMAAKKTKRYEIDYLHPDGKPTSEPAIADETDAPIEQKIKDARSIQKSIEEADGHHVCSNNCQKHHSVKVKGACKTP